MLYRNFYSRFYGGLRELKHARHIVHPATARPTKMAGPSGRSEDQDTRDAAAVAASSG